MTDGYNRKLASLIDVRQGFYPVLPSTQVPLRVDASKKLNETQNYYTRTSNRVRQPTNTDVIRYAVAIFDGHALRLVESD